MSEFDHTIPIGGAWVMILRPIPCPIKPPVLSIWYAMPDSIMFADAQYKHGAFLPGHHKSERHLDTLWRMRQGGKVDENKIADMKKFFDQEFYDNDIWEEIELAARVKILTPEGSLTLMPHEYNVVRDIDKYIDMVDGYHVELKELGGVKAAKKLQEMVHYCRARGISRAEAMKLCAGQVKRQNVFYLQLHEAYAEYFGIVDTQKYKFVSEEAA